MELKEAIEILKCLYSENADLLSDAFEFDGETIYIDEELAEEYLLDNEAIDTVLQALEDKDLDEANIRADAMLDMDKIWRNKIKEKIVNLKVSQENTENDNLDRKYQYQIDILEELLKGE